MKRGLSWLADARGHNSLSAEDRPAGEPDLEHFVIRLRPFSDTQPQGGLMK